MKIFCESHGQPLELNKLTSHWECKFDGCLVAIGAAAAEEIASRIHRVQVVELWLAPK